MERKKQIFYIFSHLSNVSKKCFTIQQKSDILKIFPYLNAGAALLFSIS